MKTSQRGGSFGGFLMLLLVGGVIGAGVCYYVLRARRTAPAVTVEAAPETSPPAATGPAPVETDGNYISRKLREWKLTPEDLQRELAAAGRIVRENGNALGTRVAGATSDLAVMAKIKAKFALDDKLQALQISVGCKDGHVTLSGSVATHELVGRAVVLALDTTGVLDVISSLQVEIAPEPPV